MAQISRSQAAEHDLVEIWLYIAQDDPAAADRVLDFLEAQFRVLAATPNMGRVREDLWPQAMCFPVFKASWRSRYLVFYRPSAEGIEIARILEGHRDITPEMFT